MGLYYTKEYLERCKERPRCGFADDVAIEWLKRDVEDMLELHAEVKRLKDETLLLGLLTEECSELRAVIEEMDGGDNADLWGTLVKQRDNSKKELDKIREVAAVVVDAWEAGTVHEGWPDDLRAAMERLRSAAKIKAPEGG